jgi:hypothetical protein
VSSKKGGISEWTPQLIKTLEGVTLNKVTLKQYQDLYSNLAAEEEGPKVLSRRLRLISSSFPF